MTDRREKRFFRPDVRRDVDDEIAYHLEMRQRELVERGVLPGDAHDAVTRRFGDVAAVARECRAIDEAWYREQRRARMMSDLRQDVAYAVRVLAKAPAFSVVAIVTLALGIGATTAIFSLANWALLRPVPGVERSRDVHQVWTGTRRGATGFSPGWLSYPNFTDITPRLQTVTLAGEKTLSAAVGRGDQGARPVRLAYATASYFDVLGVRMRAGRAFTAAEDAAGGAAPVMVVSERFAKATFGTPSAALGQVLKANGVACTIIGVAAGGFQGTDRVSPTDIWVPGALYPVLNHMPSLRYDDRRGGGYYELVARLRPGATWAQADAELQSMAAWLASQYPKENAKFAGQTAFNRMGPIGANPLGREKTTKLTALMLAVSVLVLLIACSNVASLLMMRGVGRSGEVAVRKALGASRMRLVRQHLTEGAILWLVAGAVATLVVWWGLRSADGAALLGLRGGVAEGVPVDWRVVAFATTVSLVVGLLFSVAPALRAMRVEAAQMMRQESPAASPRGLRVGTSLTVVQLALSMTLVVGALLLTTTSRQLAAVDLGFDPAQLYTFHIRPGSVGYTAPQAALYRDEFARQLALVPGVEQVSLSMRAPFVSPGMGTSLLRPGTKERLDTDGVEVTTANYFETLRIPLRRGRLFTQEDLGTATSIARPVVIVSESLGRELFGHADPIGRSVEFRVMGKVGKPFEIVGVVGDVRYDSLIEDPPPVIYEPADPAMAAARGATFVIRAQEGTDVGAAIQKISSALNPSLPVILPQSMSEGIARSRAEWDALARLMTALAAVAALLAAVGLYGVVAFGVASRRREFGIRLALGARPREVMALVFRRTAVIAAISLLLGIGGAVALARALSSRLFGVTPFDPVVWTLSALTLVAVAILASWIPARRAVAVDVTSSLRAL